MEPFIQLTYSEQCPQKTSQLTETSFIDKRKVPENFWFDLLERKCPEGLGEVTKSLVNDDGVLTADFLADQNVPQDVSASEQSTCSNDCLTNPKTVDCNEFKTPQTSRYNHKVSETPCLFSQDESVNHTPTSSIKSQSTCHGGAMYKSVDTSPSTPQVVRTPVALSQYTSGSDWSRRRATTPDIIAEIMGQRTSSLSCLLAGGSDNDVTEWSESMATPPLKVQEPAGDETDGEKGHLEEIDENASEEEGQPPSKRIARVLFSGSATNQSMEPVELSVDDVNTLDQPLEPMEGKDAMLDTAHTVDNSCIAEEFFLEYSCHDDSKCNDSNISKTLLEDPLRPPPSLDEPPRCEAVLDDKVISSSPVDASPKPIQLQSPYPNNIFSPTTQIPFQALAQSTPKPVSSEIPDKVITRITSSTSYNTEINDRSVTRDYDTSLTSDANDSPSPLCDKTQVQATSGVTCHATEVNGNLEFSDVTFGSPSRSFELAMAREADKLFSGVERESRTSGLGSSLSASLNAQSIDNNDILNKTTNFQLTEVPQQVIKTRRDKVNAEKEISENTVENSGERTTRSADDHGSLVRRRSFCKVPGLRRSVRTKRFSYPTASQVAKQDTSKRIRKTATTVDVSRVVEKENSTSEEGKVVTDHSAKFDGRAVCDTSENKGVEGEMPVSKRLKSDEMTSSFESERDVGLLSSTANHIDKEDVLFDMDALSQFPVECICSPPPLNCVSDSLNGHTVAWTARQGKKDLISEGIGNMQGNTDTVLQEIDESTVCEADEVIYDTGVQSVERTLQNEDEEKESDTTENNVSSAYLQKDALPLRPESNTGFHTGGGKKIEISDKALGSALPLFEKLDLPKTSFTSHECGPTADEVAGAEWPNKQTEEPSDSMVCDVGELASTSCKTTPDSDSVHFSSCTEGEIVEQRDDHRYISKRENISGLEKHQSSMVSGFCGFSTASGKQVYVSESAMKKAKKTLSEIDAELNVSSNSRQALNVTGTSHCIRNGHKALENGQGSAPLEGPSDGTTRASEKELENALLDGPSCGTRKNSKTSQLKDTSQSDQLNIDVSGRSSLIRRSEIEAVALQNVKQAVDEFESNQNENINDSLLEDLLNDCKRKRRDSLATICEESEEIEEHHQGIATGMDEDSDLKRFRSGDNESSKYHENVATEYCHSGVVKTPRMPNALFQTASGKSVSISQADLSKARNTWNKIDQELALAGTDRLQRKDLEGRNGFQTVPDKLFGNLQSSLSTCKAARCITKKVDEGIEKDGQCRRVSGLSTFSGFQTAGGKKVNLSEEALRRGRDIMKRIATDASEDCLGKEDETSSSFTAGNRSPSRKNDRASKDDVDRRDLEGNKAGDGKDYLLGFQTRRGNKKEETNKASKSTAFLGFQTAAGKRVEMPEEALQRGAQIMQQIDNSIEHAINKRRQNADRFTGLPNFHNDVDRSFKMPDRTSNETQIMPQIEKSFEGESGAHTIKFAGFQTAAGKSLKPSEDALRKGGQIMQKIDSSLEQSERKTGPNTTGLTAFSGFQTAAGKNVNLSKESLEKGAVIMQQIDKSLENNKGTNVSHSRSTTGFSGFQTASGQSVNLSKESLQKGAAIMQQIDKSLEQIKDSSVSHSRSTTGFSGFQTASGQSVNLSKESLLKGAAIMNQVDKSLEQSKDTSVSHSLGRSGFSGFQTASGQSVNLSKESLQKGAAIMQQIDKSLEQIKDTSVSDSLGRSGFSGFQTASGQNVNLSKESLQKGAAIMQQIDKSLEKNKDTSVSHSLGRSGFSGFQTASGQNVTLSKGSLQKGAAIMQQIDKSLEQSKDTSVSDSLGRSGFSGFQTASGQSVNLSKESLQKGAAIMQQIDKSLQENGDNIVSVTGLSRSAPSSTSSSAFSGFQTAGGKTVQISESALAKAKQTVTDIERELQIANLDATTISHDAAWKARERMNLTEQETGNSTTFITNGNHGNTYKGFFTAGGQSVSVSEEALKKANAFVLDTDGAFADSKVEKTAASIVPTEVYGRTVSTPSRSCSIEHDEAVSREVLESSEALLAYESIMNASGNCCDRTAVGWSSFNTSEGSFILEREKGVACSSNHNFPRRCSTPLRCSEDMFNPNLSETRDGMKPCSTTPSGVLHDRRAQFHAPLRARLTTVESSCSPRGSDGNRSLRPLRTMTPGCFKSKAAPSPRASTPLNSTANRKMSGPRPQFITPYRKQEAGREVSPLARCSSSSLPLSGLSEVRGGVDIVEPSSKKLRISAPNSTSDTKNGPRGTASKSECKVKPQPGFLSQLRRQNQRIKLKNYVGHNTLPGQFTTAELMELGVSPEVISVTSLNAESFRFSGRKYFSESVLPSEGGVRTEDGGVLHAGTDGCVGLEEIQSAFLSTPGVDSQLISTQWIANHYRWLVWKLAAMEVAFPRQFAGRCLTPDWVLCQLKYRYDREIDNSNRSALKKIMERDDISSRTMVLCVSSVTVTANQTENLATEQKDNDGEKDGQGAVNKMELQSSAIIEVTDGWYGIRAMLDRSLTRLLHDRKIAVGQKLFVYGAELIGSEQAVSPLEAPSSLMLRLHANSTRRARWDVKLGFHSHTHAFPLPLASLFGDGGFTGCVDVIVLRQYPVQWMEKMSDGTNVFRNSRLEEREAKRFESDRHQRREKLFLKIQEEFEKECQQPVAETRRSARFRRRSFSSRDLSDFHDGKEIYEALTQASDPDAVKECLDERQIRALEDYRRLLQERKCAELQSKFERVWKEREDEQRQLQRNVVPLLKVRIADYLCKGQAMQNAVLSIWRPSEDVMHLLSEGSRLRIYHLAAAGVRNRQGATELQLSATRTTRYEDLPSDPDAKRMVYVPRQACSFDELQSCSEVDVVGLVVFCSPPSSFSSSSIQTVYLSDEECNLVAIKFWGGLKAVAVEDLVKPRSFISCSNLTVRADDRLQCPSLTFSELSTLTLKPRESHLRTALNNLQQNIPDLDLFMCSIQQTLDSILHPSRASPSMDVKVNTVRMYGQLSDEIQSYDSTLGKQSLHVMDSLDSSGKENNSSYNGLEHRSVGLTPQSTSCSDHTVSHRSSVSSLEEPARLATPGASAHAKSRQLKRKLLDSIAEPPPLSPLPSSIPASVRREFKRPRHVEGRKMFTTNSEPTNI